MRRAGYLATFGLLAAVATSVPASAQSVTVGTADPDTPNCIPFGCPDAFGISRYQQVFSSSAFSGITGPIIITGLSFFHTGGEGLDLANAVFTVFLSSTTAAVNALSTTLGNNVGANNALFGTFTATGGAAPSQLTINGPAGFLFDPTLGSNLLMDIFVSGVGADGVMAFLDSDASGTVMSRAYVSGGIGAEDASSLVTQFTYSQIDQLPTVTPEPATLSLLGAGLLGLGGWRRRRTKVVEA